MKVIWFNNMPTPYVVGRFDALVALRPTWDFEAWFAERRAADRSWDVDERQWSFPHRYCGKSTDALVAAARERPDVFVGLYESPLFLAGLAGAKIGGAAVAVRALPTWSTWVRRHWHREIVKHVLFRAVDGVLVPGEDGRRQAQRYGASSERVHSVTQSVAVRHYASGTVADRRHIRARFGFEEQTVVVLFVGRLWSGKGLDVLLDSFRSLQDADCSMELLIVGDGIDADRYQTTAPSRVHFAGFVQPADLPPWYAAADMLVFPTLGDPHGLVVEEAMSAGLPVVASDAAGDIRDRVERTGTGICVPAGDSSALAAAIAQLAGAPSTREAMAERARVAASRCTHEQWADDAVAAIELIARGRRLST